MSRLTDARKKAIYINDCAECIKGYVEKLMDDYLELCNDYDDVLKERDELAERVKELEEKYEN